MDRDEVPDQIEVLGIEMLARHGVYEEERKEGRLFRVDVVATLGERLRGFDSDRLEDTVDYTQLAEVVHEVLSGPPCQLVEHLAERIASGCLRVPKVVVVDVRLRKRALGVAGGPEWVGVRIVRRRAP